MDIYISIFSFEKIWKNIKNLIFAVDEAHLYRIRVYGGCISFLQRIVGQTLNLLLGRRIHHYYNFFTLNKVYML